MNIFLTGGTGFVGSHLLNLLSTTPHHVTALCREQSKTCIDIKKQPVWLNKNMDKLETSDFSGIDTFIHLASIGVSPKTATWNELFYWNVLVTLDLFEKAHKAGVKRFVVAGTFAEYGLSADNYEYIPAEAPLLPTSAYAASKAAAFIAAHAFAIENQIELCYLRIFSAYGEGQYINNFWPSLKSAALNGEDFLMTPGGQIRDFMPVEKVAEAFLYASEDITIVKKGIPTVANVGTGNTITMLEFAEKCWAEFGATGKIIAGAKTYRPNEPMRYVPLITK